MKSIFTRSVCSILAVIILMFCTASATNMNLAPILDGAGGNGTDSGTEDGALDGEAETDEECSDETLEVNTSVDTGNTSTTAEDTADSAPAIEEPSAENSSEPEATEEVPTEESTEAPIESTTESTTEAPTESTTEAPTEATTDATTEAPATDAAPPAETEAPITFDPEKVTLPPLQRNDAIDPTKPMIALTFDDGPTAYTDRLLDYFAQYGGKATFFVVGSHLDYRPDTIRRIVNEGHDIGGHSWDHSEMPWLSTQQMIDQITWTRYKICELTGKDTYLMRLPYGSFSDEVKRVGAGVGVAFVNWSVDTLDWKLRNADAVYDKIISSAYDGAVILCHDLHKTTVDAMEKVIPRLIADGYQLVTFTEMMSYATERLESGSIYYRR